MINNPCEFIKQIHADPLKKIEDLTIRDYRALKDHLQVCEKCDMLVSEVLERYQDYKPDPNLNDGKFN